MRHATIRTLVLGLLLVLSSSAPAADEQRASLAGTRTHFSMAEPIEFAVLYKNDGGNAKSLSLEISHSDGSTVTLDVPFDAPAGKSQARMVTLHPNTLKPGEYMARMSGQPKLFPPLLFRVARDEHPLSLIHI